MSDEVQAEADGSQYSVRAVERVTDILDKLQEAVEGVSLVTLAETTGMPKSSVFRYLSTLEARGYVEKDPESGDYTLGLALPSRRRYFDVLAARVRPSLERLRDRFGETVNFGVLEGDRVLYVEIIESHKTMRLAARRGDRDYLHSTALGKAIAAGLGADEVRRILTASGMPANTPRTISDADAYLGAIEQVRADGFAIDDEENEAGARCVAVAVDGLRVPAGISVSAPAVRLSREEAAEVAVGLAAEARRLARRSGGVNADRVG
jgi:IclR family acetate operon transcriptional repressor